jgi:hypothetical protein
MKNLDILVLILFITFSCNHSTNSGKNEDMASDTVIEFTAKKVVQIDPVQVKADKLVKCFELINTTDSIKIRDYDLDFFEAFPNSFTGMQELFGYDDVKKAAPLYAHPKTNGIIQYFSNLTTIPKEIYYEKYINICIDGVWEADNIRAAFGIEKRLLNDTEAACSILDKRTDSEIISLFSFIFDGPHPKNDTNEQKYINLHSALKNQNERLSRLFAESYKQIMAKDDGHGH